MNEGNDKNLISLKEASALTGYSADYIGQLIRAGKLPGKQVYVNVAWMTTAEAVLSYKKGENSLKNEKKSLKSFFYALNRKIGMELQIIKLFFQTLKSAKSVIMVLFLSFLFLNLYLFYYLGHSRSSGTKVENAVSTEEMSY